MAKVFQEWAYTNDNRTNEIVVPYNERMNTHIERSFDGNKYLKTVGASPSIKLRTAEECRLAHDRGSDSVLHDHVVGAGKTYTVIGVMERRRLGFVSQATGDCCSEPPCYSVERATSTSCTRAPRMYSDPGRLLEEEPAPSVPPVSLLETTTRIRWPYLARVHRDAGRRSGDGDP